MSFLKTYCTLGKPVVDTDWFSYPLWGWAPTASILLISYFYLFLHDVLMCIPFPQICSGITLWVLLPFIQWDLLGAWCGADCEPGFCAGLCFWWNTVILVTCSRKHYTLVQEYVQNGKSEKKSWIIAKKFLGALQYLISNLFLYL